MSSNEYRPTDYILLGITDIQCVKERRDSIFPKNKREHTHDRLITYFLVRDAASMMYEDYTNTRYQKSVRIDNATS